MMFRTLLLSLLLLLAPSAAVSGTILIVGDSLSAAYGMPVEQGWVNLLEKRLISDRYACTVVNASISGDTTANARARLPQALDRHQPSIVVLEVGGNDGLRGLSLAAMKNNLAAMIKAVEQHNADVLLLGVSLPPNYGPIYTGAFHKVYRQLAEEYGVVFVPSLIDEVGTQSELMQIDGIHPNSKAQPLIVARVWKQLQLLIDRARNENR